MSPASAVHEAPRAQSSRHQTHPSRWSHRPLIGWPRRDRRGSRAFSRPSPGRSFHSSTGPACATVSAGDVRTAGGARVRAGSTVDGAGASWVTRHEDTIASIVTGPASQGAVAIVRLSGREAVPIAQRLFRRASGTPAPGWRPRSHRVYYGTAVQGEQLLDEVLLLAMLSPRSYTREDVIELHTHGGGLCAQRVLQACIQAGARLARPGEYTLRAFLNGRLDLAQAESVAQLVGARTAAAAEAALGGLRGGIGAEVAAIRGEALALLAEVEARIDFEEDVGALNPERVAARVADMQAAIEAALRTARAGALLRTGLQVALVGRPNVGKSSLLNAWAREERAIVTDVAGTTRDVVEAPVVAGGGVPLLLLDTAGIRESRDKVEAIGVERSRAAAEAADVVAMVVDSSEGWTRADSDIFAALWGDGAGSSTCRVRGPAVLVANKADVTPCRDGGAAQAAALSLPLAARDTFRAVVVTSALTRQGLPELEVEMLRLAGAPALAGGGVSWAVNQRQSEALVRAHEALMHLAASMRDQLPLDCWTVDLRSAVLALGEVSGEAVGEEVLDAVFSTFCIGK